MYLYMFSILSIHDKVTDETLYINQHPNSPHTHRPLFIAMGKEEVMGEDIGKLGKERELILSAQDRDGYVAMGKTPVTITSNLTLCDGKMRKSMLGLGGAWCMLCHVDLDTGCGRGDKEPEEYFYITRTGGEIKSTYDELEKDSEGRVKTKPHDYEERGGHTQAPLVQDEEALDSLIFVSPLHCLMRVFSWLLRLLYHLRSGVHVWSESKLVLGRSYQFYTQAKEESKAEVLRLTGILMDAPDPTGRGGNTLKGDICKRLLRDHRDVLVNLVPEQHKDAFTELLEGLWVLLYLYTKNPEPEKIIDPSLVKMESLNLYELILNSFGNGNTQWLNLSPTLHSFLAHAWELIEVNGKQSLGHLSESGLEANNKFLRNFRINKSRKRNEKVCLEDTLTRMWNKSCPSANMFRPKVHARPRARKNRLDPLENRIDGFFEV